MQKSIFVILHARLFEKQNGSVNSISCALSLLIFMIRLWKFSLHTISSYVYIVCIMNNIHAHFIKCSMCRVIISLLFSDSCLFCRRPTLFKAALYSLLLLYEKMKHVCCGARIYIYNFVLSLFISYSFCYFSNECIYFLSAFHNHLIVVEVDYGIHPFSRRRES